MKRFPGEMHYLLRPEIWGSQTRRMAGANLYLPQWGNGFVKEKINFFSRIAQAVSIWHGNPVLDSNWAKPMFEKVSSGSRIFRTNSALFFMWFLFPLLLIVTSDWIGLLVIFQALTAAVRLRALPAARTLAAFSSVDMAAGGYERECRAR